MYIINYIWDVSISKVWNSLVYIWSTVKTAYKLPRIEKVPVTRLKFSHVAIFYPYIFMILNPCFIDHKTDSRHITIVTQLVNNKAIFESILYYRCKTNLNIDLFQSIRYLKVKIIKLMKDPIFDFKFEKWHVSHSP